MLGRSLLTLLAASALALSTASAIALPGPSPDDTTPASGLVFNPKAAAEAFAARGNATAISEKVAGLKALATTEDTRCRTYRNCDQGVLWFCIVACSFGENDGCPRCLRECTDECYCGACTP
ncbi:hypothetical protein DFJ73DRAFT_762061 [Zopfochytrium polystomum]|nr:hypothetical protein DFJ73DRAFT_762061 [Zopfochytrium polystomum]